MGEVTTFDGKDDNDLWRVQETRPRETETAPSQEPWVKVYEHRDGEVTCDLGKEEINRLFGESRTWRYEHESHSLCYYWRKSVAPFDAHANMLECWRSANN